MPPELTVAVVVKDRREAMARCLDALDRLTGPPGREVVLVDNGSTDGTLELLRSRAPRAAVPTRVLQAGGTVGAARNAAVAAAATPLIAFTDSDCQPRPDWAEQLVAAMTEDVDVVQGATVPAEPVVRRWAATQHITRFTELYEACNLCYRVEALRDAGGFDAGIGFFGEDTAAGWALRRRGGRGAFAPEAVVAHDVTYPGPVWHLRRGLGYRNWPQLVRRYPEMRDALLYRRWFLRRRSLATWGALAGAGMLARGRPAGLVLAGPTLWLHRPRRSGLAGAGDAVAGMMFDVAVAAGLLAGSIRARTPVL